MRTALDFVFFLIAAVLFGLTMFGVSGRRVNLLAAGLLAFTLPFLINAWPGH
jgi:hypothetical protein